VGAQGTSCPAARAPGDRQGSILQDAQPIGSGATASFEGLLLPSLLRRGLRRAAPGAVPGWRPHAPEEAPGPHRSAGVIKRASQALLERQRRGNRWRSGHGGVLSAAWHPAGGDTALASQRGDSHLGACPGSSAGDRTGGCQPILPRLLRNRRPVAITKRL